MGEFKKLLEPGYIKNPKIKNRTSMGPSAYLFTSWGLWRVHGLWRSGRGSFVL